MRKKFFLLFLVCLFTVFTASQAFSETVYELSVVDSETAELFEEDEIDFFAGGNFYGRFRLPELEIVSYDSEVSESVKNSINTDFSVKWSLKSEGLKDVIIQSEESDSNGKYLVLSGVLPTSEETATYELAFVAEITEINGEDYQSLVGKTVDVEADAIDVEILDEGYTAVEVTDMEKYGLEGEFKTVNSSYSVTVNALSDRNYNYIESADYGEYTIDLPKWLVCSNVVKDTEANEEDLEDFVDSENNIVRPITSVTIKFNDEYKGKFKNGSKGVVRITFVDGENEPDAVLSWDVELFEPFTISTSPKTLAFDLTAGGDPVVKEIEYTGADPVKFTQGTTITGVNFKVISADSKITVTAEATSAATAGEKTTTFTFNDANNNSDELSVTVKVTVPTTPKITISGTKTLTVTAGGESVSTTLTAGGSISGALSWEIVSVPDGLNVELTKSSDKTADFSISAESSATAGQKTVSIKVTDSVSSLNETANLAITVEAASQEEEKQDITSSITLKDSSGKSVSKPFSGLKPGEKGSFTITLPSEIVAKIWTLLINNVAVKTVTVSGTATMAADNDWLTISNYSSTGATIDADVPSNLSGNAAISFSVTDTNDKEYTADLGTISKTSTSTGSSGSGCNVSFGALSLAVAALLFVRKNAKN